MRIILLTILIAELSLSAGQQRFLDSLRVQKEFALIVGDYNKFASDTKPIKCLTPLIMDVRRNSQFLTRSQLSRFMEIISRPALPRSIVSPSGHFRIHYDPAYVDSEYLARCASYFDYAWHVEVDSFGFLPPVPDGTLGGDSLLDVYILRLPAGQYGMTIADDIPGPAPWNDSPAFIKIRNEYDSFPPNDDPEGSEWGALKVTAAHELFHTIQMAYDKDEEVWMLEIASVWMEDMVYNYVNDYYNYLNYFFDYPWLSLLELSTHMYASAVFFRYFSDNYGYTIIKRIFEQARYFDGMYAISAALDSQHLDINTEFAKFVGWNFITDTLADSFHYEEATSYPPMKVEATVVSLPYTYSPRYSRSPRSWGANYIYIPSPPPYLKATISGATTVFWNIVAVILSDSSNVLTEVDSIWISTHGLPVAVAVAPSGINNPYNVFPYTLTIYGYEDIEEKHTFSGKDIKIFPNPFNETLNIKVTSPSNIYIYSVDGKLVDVLNAVDSYRWVPENLPSGIYLIKSIYSPPVKAVLLR